MAREILVAGTEISVDPLNANFKELYENMSTLSTASGSQAARIGTLETNYTTLNGNVNTLMNTTVPNKAESDLSNVNVASISTQFKSAFADSISGYMASNIMPDWSAKVELTQNQDNIMQNAGWVLMHCTVGMPAITGAVSAVTGLINNIQVYRQVGAGAYWHDYDSIMVPVDIGDVVRVNNPDSGGDYTLPFLFLFIPFKGGSNA